jgi:hypothetical protein
MMKKLAIYLFTILLLAGGVTYNEQRHRPYYKERPLA